MIYHEFSDVMDAHYYHAMTLGAVWMGCSGGVWVVAEPPKVNQSMSAVFPAGPSREVFAVDERPDGYRQPGDDTPRLELGGTK